jgi:hypothetical protein
MRIGDFMKRAIVLGLAALSLAVPAVAQIDAAGAAKYADAASQARAQPYAFDHPTSAPLSWGQVRPDVLAQLRVAVPEMRLACAADRQTFCADITDDVAADRCIARHRFHVTAPCRQARQHVQMAWQGRL